jgi:hypothetical protein
MGAVRSIARTVPANPVPASWGRKPSSAEQRNKKRFTNK